MGKSPTTIITYVILLCAAISSAQDIYVYPNKRLADQGLIEYRPYILEEAHAYQQGGSLEAYLTTIVIAFWPRLSLPVTCMPFKREATIFL